jgi:hypothetical protein
MVWLPCPSPAYPATTQAKAQISPTARDHPGPLPPLDEPQHGELGDHDHRRVRGKRGPERGRGDPRRLDAVRAQPRLELPVAGEEQHEAHHTQLHHGPVAEQLLPAAPGPARSTLDLGARGIRTVAMITTSSRNIAASIENSSVNELARAGRRRDDRR